MLDLSDFHPYQHRAIAHCVEHPRSMLWLDMSLGKTSCVLTAIDTLLKELKIYRALVLAPRLVCETVWRQEIAKWRHVSHLRAALLRGSTAQRTRELLRPDVDIHLINYEAIPWLVNTVNEQFLARGKYPPWNMVVYDEVDRLKDSSGKRFQQLEKLVGLQKPSNSSWFPYRIGMTGTPADNGYVDLHGQYKMVDDGKRLLPAIGEFRTAWCKAGYGERTWEVRAGCQPEIERRIKDITLSMSTTDYLDLPDYVEHDHWITLPPKLQRQYDSLEDDMFASMDRHEEDPLDGEYDLRVHSAPSARTKCRQVCNGAFLVPENTGEVVLVHDLKLDVLDSIMHEAAGKPVLLAYQFRHDMARIMERYAKQGYRVAYIGPGVKDVEGVVNAWNAGRYHLLASHAASLGHGVNLQFGGSDLVWFGLSDNLRHYRQFNARLRRMGQAAPNVNIRRILAESTVDVAMSALLKGKTATAEGLRKALTDYRDTKHNATRA